MLTRRSKDLTDPYLDYGIDVHNRRIFLIDDIKEESISTVIKGLFYLDSLYVKPIELFIGSLGGSEYEMFALYDTIQSLKSPVHTIGIGKCMSAAPLLVACGTPGYRYAMSNTWFMVHQSWDDLGEKRVDEFRQSVLHMEILSSRWYDLMEKHTKRDKKFWKKCTQKSTDSFFDVDEALTLGIIDEIRK